MNRIASTVTLLAVVAGSNVALAQSNEADSGKTVLAVLSSGSGGGVDAPGDNIGCAIDLDTLTGDIRNLGIEFAWGYYFVSRSGEFVTGTQVISQYDADFNLVEEYFQITGSATWGGRDGAAIESENALFFGAEGGEVVEYRWDPGTERLDLSQSQVMQFDSTRTIRAMAWDSDNQVFYTKDFNNAIEIFDRSGALINFGTASVSAYGAGYNPLTQTVWFHGYRTGTTGGADAPKTRIAEWDPATGTMTGNEFDIDPAGDTAFVGYIAGGMDIIVDGTDVTAVTLGQGDPFDYAQLTAIVGDGEACGGGCRADLDGDGDLTIFDFLTFSNLFDSGDLAADFDGDGALTIFDFLTFSNEFDAGCP